MDQPACPITTLNCLTIVLCFLQNSPLFIEVFSKQEALPFHYIVHCALDAVEEKGGGVMCSLDWSHFCMPHLRSPCYLQWLPPARAPVISLTPTWACSIPQKTIKGALLGVLHFWQNLLKHVGSRHDGDHLLSCICCSYASDARGLMACRCMDTSATHA